MDYLSYGELVDQWKVDLMVARAKNFGFRGEQILYVQQQLIDEVVAFEFDEEKSNGCQERTALQSLIDNQLKKIIRTDKRYGTLKKNYEEELLSRATPEPDRTELVMDVHAALASLSEQDQKICELMIEGCKQQQIADRLNCGWHTVKRSIERIRTHFKSLGLDGYNTHA